VLQVVVSDLDNAFSAFFRRVKAGETPGYPRFKGKNRFSSFGFKEYGNGFRIDGRRLRLSSIGRIAVRWHRPVEGKIKTLRLIEKAGKWYACFVCEVEPQEMPATGQEVGIDLGVASLLTTSDGTKVENPRWYRAEQRKLRVLHRRVARRKLRGNNRRKAVRQLQRQYERIANRRKDYLNKLAHSLIQQYDRIALEDLRIAAMVKNRHLSKSILDAGWGFLTARLHVKAAEAGRVVVLVEPAYTSKSCSACGHIFEELRLNQRWVTCRCGLSLDRDHNAALNILKRAGQARWGISSSLDGLPQEAADL
ncbi:MAG TPA: transposase, partial [Herpetosiphonaceae bacterium]